MAAAGVAAEVTAAAGGGRVVSSRGTTMASVGGTVLLLVCAACIIGCGGSASGPQADRDKSVEEVAAGAEKMSESSLQATIEEYREAIEAEQDPDAARKLKDRLKAYTDELTRRSQK